MTAHAHHGEPMQATWLIIAGLAAWPVNRWLIARGRGHAVMHAHRY